jgi:sugar (pentulose or hexulose) kinase
VISTGTWVIIMAVGGRAQLDPKADMLANVNVRGEPVSTARFMGGREYAVLARDAPADADEADVADVIASGTLALPAFSDQGGPFAARKGVIEGPAPTTPKARSALATLYCALMTAHMLRRLEAPGELIVEGGFTRSPAFAAVLARLMPGRRVLIAPMSAGAAAGAAMLAHWGDPHPSPRLEPARGWDLRGLEAYQDRWERAL